MRFSKPVTLFSLFGFKIKADASWIFLSILISWTLMHSVFPNNFPGYDSSTYQSMAIWALLGLIASIIIHELAHAIIAEYYGMPILSIRLFIFGGVAEFKGRPSHARGEFWMAIAGPIMSGGLGLFFISSYQFFENMFGVSPFSQVLYFLGVLNILLALFNSLPAFPLDGGRALRALIWARKNNLVIATRIASNLGEFFAYALIGYGCYRLTFFNDTVGAIWSALLGVFMLGAGAYAVRQTESWALLSGQYVRDFMNRDFVSVSPDLTLDNFVENYVYKFYQHSFPVVDHGKLIGLINVQDIMQQDKKKWSWTHVGSKMIPACELQTIEEDREAADALDKMERLGLRTLMVTKDSKLVGVLSLSDITNYLGIIMKLDRARTVQKSV